MAIKTKAEILEGLKAFIPEEDTSDETLAFMTDLSETLDAGADGASWKQKYTDNDAAWKKKYKDAFFNPPVEKPEDEPGSEPKKLRFEDLFKTE